MTVAGLWPSFSHTFAFLLHAKEQEQRSRGRRLGEACLAPTRRLVGLLSTKLQPSAEISGLILGGDARLGTMPNESEKTNKNASAEIGTCIFESMWYYCSRKRSKNDLHGVDFSPIDGWKCSFPPYLGAPHQKCGDRQSQTNRNRLKKQHVDDGRQDILHQFPDAGLRPGS